MSGAAAIRLPGDVPMLSALVCSLLSVVAQPTGPVEAPPHRTVTIDAVKASTGEEVDGRTDLAVLHEGIAYRFSSPETLDLFRASPSLYEVADGGACGAMGALSGMGDARRFAVHNGRIYFFASDGCRAGFLKDPSRCIETDDPKPEASDAKLAEGQRLLQRVVEWAGGADRLKSIKSYRQSLSRIEGSGDDATRYAESLALRFPDRAVLRQSWNDAWFSTIRGPEGAAMAKEGAHEVVAGSRGRAFDRQLARNLVTILRRAASNPVDGTAVIAVADGAGAIGDDPVRFILVWMDGALSRLTIEEATGRPIELAFRGRDRTAFVGESVRTFTRYETVSGVTLPVAHTVVFNGKPAESAGLSIDGYGIDVEIPDEELRVVARPE